MVFHSDIGDIGLRREDRFRTMLYNTRHTSFEREGYEIVAVNVTEQSDKRGDPLDTESSPRLQKIQ